MVVIAKTTATYKRLCLSYSGLYFGAISIVTQPTQAVPAQARMSPELQQLALNFLAVFFSRRPLLNNDRLLVVNVHEVHLYVPFT